MKHLITLGTFAAAFAMMASATTTHAEPFDSKLQASTYKTKLVQADDECLPGATNIGGVDACAPANVNTDGTQFSVGSLSVKSVPVSSQVLTILKSSGNGGNNIAGDNKKDLGGKTVQTRLVLRITKRTTTTGVSTLPLTWVDQVLLCSPATVSGTGNIVMKHVLAGTGGGTCGLLPIFNSTDYQKEIVSASVIDAGTGKPIAVPGVRKK